MSVWFTADWHLGEKRLDLFERPFKTTDENTEVLIAKHNEVVKPDDEVIVVGDVVFDPAYLHHVARFNGIKTLIKGNHDRKCTDLEFAAYFDRIVDEGGGIYMNCDPKFIDGMECSGMPLCYVTHYPTQADHKCFNIVGHIHGAWRLQLNMLNVGVDVHHFYPVPISQVKFYYEAACKFYDDDVWVAYDPVNMDYLNQRGKKGRYFEGPRRHERVQADERAGQEVGTVAT